MHSSNADILRSRVLFVGFQQQQQQIGKFESFLFLLVNKKNRLFCVFDNSIYFTRISRIQAYIYLNNEKKS